MTLQPIFYRFLGVHSLLIGLFPFFIPVYLWNAGFTLADISLFLAVSGASFCLALRVWEWFSGRVTLSTLMAITLVLELALLAVNFNYSLTTGFLLVFGVANGIYNCFYWTTQRTLFLDIIASNDSGRQYGNFQIFVMVFLKGGIFAGGIMLEHLGFQWVFLTSAVIVALSVLYLSTTGSSTRTTSTTRDKPITLQQLAQFRDQYRSRTIFIIDSLFLFLESHFWTISLFLVMEQNFARLGIIVIVLALIFAALFYVAKNRIDRIMGRRIYRVAVVLYAASWLLRAGVSEDLPTQSLFILLLFITFFSSFFRLAFNKRFYDNAKSSDARDYLIIKSYFTQSAVVVVFSTVAAAAMLIDDDPHMLRYTYLIAGIFSLGYLVYRRSITAKIPMATNN